MTTLSEQEKAWQDFNSKNITPLSAWDRKLFRAGFEAGLAYNKARVKELEAKLAQWEQWRFNSETGQMERR